MTTPSEQATKRAREIAQRHLPTPDSCDDCVGGPFCRCDQRRASLAADIARAIDIPEGPTMWWDADGESAMSAPEEYPPWCELKHGDIVGFTCAKSCPPEWYKRVDRPDSDDFDIVKLTPEEEAVQRDKERQERRRRQKAMDEENDARRQAAESARTHKETGNG